MNYKKAIAISNICMWVGLGFALLLYMARVTDTLSVLIAVISGAFVLGGIIIRLLRYRCPYCSELLPRGEKVPGFCPSCGKKLDPTDKDA